MNGWEFARYFVDMIYAHWCVTAFFLYLMFNRVSILGNEIYMCNGKEENDGIYDQH